MTAREIIEQILVRHPDISKKVILERLDKEKRKTGGFIAENVLLRMIAAEFGVEISKEAPALALSMRDLIPSLNDVTVVGRVVAIFPSRTFKGGKSGKIASFLIAGKSSLLRIVLWNDKTNLIDSGEVEVGQIVRVSHGYSREDYSGKVELHLGDRSAIEINPKGVEARNYPAISKFMTKIGEITQTCKNKNVNVTGTVEKLFPVSTFKRQDSNDGKVMRFILADETGEIAVVVWNEKVDELEDTLKKNVTLQLVNAKAKNAMNKGLEIHVNSQTYVKAITLTEECSKIADLREGLKHVNVKGVIVAKPVLRTVKTSKGELVRLAVFELKDETGKIWVSAWREHADIVSNFKAGDRVIMRDCYIKKGFRKQLEMSTRNKTRFTLFPTE